MSIKITDTLPPKGSTGSRLESWWNGKGFKDIYKAFRSGSIPQVFLNKIKDVREVEKIFQLRGFQFGNWVNNEDRFNYLAALGISLYDLNQVLKFKSNNLGLDHNLGVAFGARGVRGAVAHFESHSNIINMTRYYDADKFISSPSKAVRFVNSGGVGSFAHEYGHFLDYFFGAHVEPHNSIYALSNGRSTNAIRIPYDKKKYPLRAAMEDILEMAYFSTDRKNPSTYIRRILKALPKQDYWVRRNEIFARLFEQYIAYKLQKLKINNKFLTQTKYTQIVYMTPREFSKVVPLFDRLLSLMRMSF